MSELHATINMKRPKNLQRVFQLATATGIALGALLPSPASADENMNGRQRQSESERNGGNAQREMDGKPMEGHRGIHWNYSELLIEWGFNEGTAKLTFDGSVELTYGPGALGAAEPLPEDKATSMTGERTWKSPASSGARRGITIPALYADAVLGPTRTILTVRTESGSFSFQPADLATGPILAPEYGFFIRSMKKPQASRAAQKTWPPSAELLAPKIRGDGGLTGWGTKTDISVVAHAGAEPLVLFGGALQVPPRSVMVHPGPTPNYDVAVGWRSPISGKVAIRAKVAHVFRGGNGVEWSVRHDGQAGHRILARGLLESGKAAEIPAAADADKLAALDVAQGEFVSLRIGDQNISWWSREPSFESEAATAREFMAELARHHPKTVRQQTRELPEQTWEGAMEALHGKREWPAFPQVPYESPMKVDVPCKYLTGLWRIGAWQIVKNCPRVKQADLTKLHSIRTSAGEIREKLEAADTNDPDGIYIVADHPFIPLAVETDRIILALDQMGMHDVARDGITVWLELQQPDGALFISSYDDTRHSIGALTILCAAMEHYQLTGNREWLEREQPRLRKAVERIIERRRKTMKETLTSEEAEQLRLGRNWSPYGLQLRMPCGDGEQGDPRVDGHFEVLEDNFLSDNPWVRSKKHDYDPGKDQFAHAGWGYQSGWERVPDYYLLKDDIPNFLRAWLNRFATDINLGNWTFNEHTTWAANDKSHGNAVFLTNFRNMLAMEIGDALWLARATPRELLLRLRHPKAAPIKSVSVNGMPWTDFDTENETISLKGLTGAISVQASY